eukprot:158338_1
MQNNTHDCKSDSDSDLARINWDSGSDNHEQENKLFELSNNDDQKQQLCETEIKTKLPLELTTRDHLKAMEQIYSVMYHFQIKIEFGLVFEIIEACYKTNRKSVNCNQKRRICSHCCLSVGNEVTLVTKLVFEWKNAQTTHCCQNSNKFSIYPDKKSRKCSVNEQNNNYTGIFHPKYHMKCRCNSDPIDGCCIQFPTNSFKSLQQFLISILKEHKIRYNVDCKSELYSYIITTYTISDCDNQFLSQYFQYENINTNITSASASVITNITSNREANVYDDISQPPSPSPPPPLNPKKRNQNSAGLENTNHMYSKKRKLSQQSVLAQSAPKYTETELIVLGAIEELCHQSQYDS